MLNLPLWVRFAESENENVSVYWTQKEINHYIKIVQWNNLTEKNYNKQPCGNSKISKPMEIFKKQLYGNTKISSLIEPL